jgi:hypothetical protein
MAKTNREWIIWHLQGAHKFMSDDSIEPAERVGYGLSAIEEALKRLGKPAGIGYPVINMHKPDELKHFDGPEGEKAPETATGTQAPAAETAQSAATE